MRIFFVVLFLTPARKGHSTADAFLQNWYWQVYLLIRLFHIEVQKSFFDKTNSKINELKKAYDEKIAKIEQEKNEILKSNEEFTLNIQESNKKLIEMVENFIKGGKE